MSDQAQWYYFGCKDRPGHYLFDQHGRTIYSPPFAKMENRFDGVLCPQFKGVKYFQACLSRLGGYGYSALAWHDNSVDTRSGSNSVIFAPDMTISAEDMLAEAKVRFPWVFSRTKTPVTILPLNTGGKGNG